MSSHAPLTRNQSLVLGALSVVYCVLLLSATARSAPTR